MKTDTVTFINSPFETISLKWMEISKNLTFRLLLNWMAQSIYCDIECIWNIMSRRLVSLIILVARYALVSEQGKTNRYPKVMAWKTGAVLPPLMSAFSHWYCPAFNRAQSNITCQMYFFILIVLVSFVNSKLNLAPKRYHTIFCHDPYLTLWSGQPENTDGERWVCW